ncbi:hypothetical protein BGY98DRAFT_1177236 [Russula aff. rugulosa BPL654]|nr:hypothetical protein BGY98DRAFT_1177236 [Russula aff. rugulosa BPL654]
MPPHPSLLTVVGHHRRYGLRSIPLLPTCTVAGGRFNNAVSARTRQRRSMVFIDTSTLEGHARGSIAAGDHIVATPSRAAPPRESPYLLKYHRDSVACPHSTPRHNGLNFDANKISSSQAMLQSVFPSQAAGSSTRLVARLLEIPGFCEQESEVVNEQRTTLAELMSGCGKRNPKAPELNERDGTSLQILVSLRSRPGGEFTNRDLRAFIRRNGIS